MAIEIERKFLVRDDSWRTQADSGVFYSQGYLSTDPQRCVRVRIAGERAWLNIKSAVSSLRRLEYEYEIPLSDARELLHSACPEPPVEKTRYHVEYHGHVWEVDVFEGANAGLVVAELELADEHEAFPRPAWLGDEVSDDPRYYNMNLAQVPYTQW
ncbi:MAG: CYTH domain-containing protein [Gammaproteobacteria bacterium]|nr:MAG: CYTH domain-containing protein [Gammaproteobacteria bacterium]